MTRRMFRTINAPAHVRAVRQHELLSFEAACKVAGYSRFVMKKRLGPNGEPFFKRGLRLYILPADLKIFLQQQRAKTCA